MWKSIKFALSVASVKEDFIFMTKILEFVTPLNLLNLGVQPLCSSLTSGLLYRDMLVFLSVHTFRKTGTYDHRQRREQRSAFRKEMMVQTIFHRKQAMGVLKNS